jgi:hypothetical protein
MPVKLQLSPPGTHKRERHRIGSLIEFQLDKVDLRAIHVSDFFADAGRLPRLHCVAPVAPRKMSGAAIDVRVSDIAITY